jgi:hypothetical protein
MVLHIEKDDVTAVRVELSFGETLELIVHKEVDWVVLVARSVEGS